MTSRNSSDRGIRTSGTPGEQFSLLNLWYRQVRACASNSPGSRLHSAVSGLHWRTGVGPRPSARALQVLGVDGTGKDSHRSRYSRCSRRSLNACGGGECFRMAATAGSDPCLGCCAFPALGWLEPRARIEIDHPLGPQSSGPTTPTLGQLRQRLANNNTCLLCLRARHAVPTDHANPSVPQTRPVTDHRGELAFRKSRAIYKTLLSRETPAPSPPPRTLVHSTNIIVDAPSLPIVTHR